MPIAFNAFSGTGAASSVAADEFDIFTDREAKRFFNRRRVARMVHSDLDPGSRPDCLGTSDAIS